MLFGNIGLLVLAAVPPVATGGNCASPVTISGVSSSNMFMTFDLPACLQDDFPLASLPLLGYTVSTPEESDSIHKDYVFKLQFKSHVYFFRAESEYTFERSGGRRRHCSPLESLALLTVLS